MVKRCANRRALQASVVEVKRGLVLGWREGVEELQSLPMQNPCSRVNRLQEEGWKRKSKLKLKNLCLVGLVVCFEGKQRR